MTSDTDRQWKKAFASQALSDIRAREVLVAAGVEKCHRLHFLQMAAEKLCKAHLIGKQGYESLPLKHGCVRAVLPTIARVSYASQANGKIEAWRMKQIEKLANEIDLIAPANKSGDIRKDNSEYPWMDGGGKVQTPCLYKFPKIDEQARSMVSLISLIKTAADRIVDDM